MLKKFVLAASIVLASAAPALAQTYPKPDEPEPNK